MVEIIGTQPYYNKSLNDYYISSYDYYNISDYIYSYPLGAPVDEIFNIGFNPSKE